MSVGRLILVKHSLPEIRRDVAAREWRLSAEGRLKCLELARRLSGYAPARIVSSAEPKARETAAIVARELELEHQVGEGLHEHDRSNVGWMGRDELERAVRSFFARPGELVLGKETADQAYARFSRAVSDATVGDAAVGDAAGDPGDTTVIVAHGTVITLFVARRSPGLDPFELWKRLDLPSFIVIEPGGLPAEVVERL